MRNYSSRYEVIAERQGEKILLGYTRRKSREGLWAVITREFVSKPLVKLTGDENIHFAKKASEGGFMGPWQIHFSGRTEREAVLAGEHKKIQSMATTEEAI